MTYMEPDSGFDRVNLDSLSLPLVGQHVQVTGEFRSCSGDPECPAGTVALHPSRIDPLQTLDLSHSGDWNMVSLPLFLDDPRYQSLFAHFASMPFAYDRGYVEADSLLPGRGYWLKSMDSVKYSITGIPIDIETVAVEQGWNIVGSISVPVPVSEIITTDSNLTLSAFYAFVPALGDYVAASPIQPGAAYWVKASQSGALILRNPALFIRRQR